MPVSELLAVFFPHLASVYIDRVFRSGRTVRIQARTRTSQAVCPACGTLSRRMHSRYERRLSDTAIGGQEILIHLQVHRFLCRDDACAKKTFAEQVPALTVRYGRRSIGLQEALRAIALALGGRAGARLTHRLAVAVNRMTLIRLIRALPEPAVSAVPRIVGVDEFALRRGHSYATVLVDMQTRRPIDVLPERSADSFAAWLSAHPGVEVICRDRAGCYAEGATCGAPQAIQVADRWHLWHNLAEAVERAVARHRVHLSAAVRAAIRPNTHAEPAAQDVMALPAAVPVLRKGRVAERTRQRHAAVHDLLTQGIPIRAIAAKLALTRNTVRRFARATDPEELLVNDGTGRRPSMLREHASYLHQRWNEGCTDATRLWQEIRARGYLGSYSHVRDYLAPLRSATTIPPPAPIAPKVRTVAAWMMSNPRTLHPDDQERLTTIMDDCPALAALHTQVKAFAALMTERRGHDLEAWLKNATTDDQPELRSFVTGLRRDQDAVTAGLTLPWSSGPVEGHVNRIKMLKRQMYGRANPDLLRRRILLAD
ncbi:ISL3 family transposase [Streptosporangium sp. NBC_01756]|uniref:ISL3 family transposase n=1 Tax=Streptosporangium sp. NBC_01756 TaxID=2975950 RepID=UPI002DDA3BE5|nr:ISL3 family transposase [Streptosporangium sp. NBC_01756]WSC90290.1 ISL3 family transposase [Streptosporangium sp. NBC_01756]